MTSKMDTSKIDMAEELSFERFEVLAEAYGGDLAAWPVEARAGAERLLAQEPRAQEVLRAAAELDALLDPLFEADLAAEALDPKAAMTAPSAALTARILADAAVAAPRPAAAVGAARAGRSARPSLGAQILTALFGEASPLAAGALGGAAGIAAAAGLAVGLVSAPTVSSGALRTAEQAEREALLEYALSDSPSMLASFVDEEGDEFLDDDDAQL